MVKIQRENVKDLKNSKDKPSQWLGGNVYKYFYKKLNTIQIGTIQVRPTTSPATCINKEALPRSNQTPIFIFQVYEQECSVYSFSQKL